MGGRGIDLVVPGHLAVVVGVDVDPARRQQRPVGLDHLPRRLVDPATAAFYASSIAVVANAEAIIAGELSPEELGVEAIDDRTLVIRLKQPTPYLLSLLTFPSTFPVHAGSIATHGEEFTRPGNLLSNGAYKLDAWTPGSVLALSRNEYYWNNAATAIDEVRHHAGVAARPEGSGRFGGHRAILAVAQLHHRLPHGPREVLVDVQLEVRAAAAAERDRGPCGSR